MMSNDDDLRSYFDVLRRADAAAAPDVDAVVERVRVQRRPRVALPVTIAAAAILMLAVGLRFSASRPTLEVSVSSPAEPSLLAWRSPTASLMQTPGRDLVLTVPTLSSSLLHGVRLESRTTPHFGR